MEGRWELPTVEPSPSWLGQAILRRVMSNSDRQIEQGTWNRAAAASMGPLPSPARKTPGRIRTPFLAHDFLPSIAPSPSFQSPVCPELFLLPVPPLCPQPPLSPSLPGSAFGVRSQPSPCLQGQLCTEDARSHPSAQLQRQAHCPSGMW